MIGWPQEGDSDILTVRRIEFPVLKIFNEGRRLSNELCVLGKYGSRVRDCVGNFR